MYSVVKLICTDTDGNKYEFYVGKHSWFVSNLDDAERFSEDEQFIPLDFDDYIEAYKVHIKQALGRKGYKLCSFVLCDVDITARKEVQVFDFSRKI